MIVGIGGTLVDAGHGYHRLELIEFGWAHGVELLAAYQGILLGHQKSTWDKLLLVAKFLDHLEQDFHKVYPDQASPMPGGYEASLRRLIEEKYKG